MADTLTAAVDVRNLRERPDGSGTVEIPIVTVAEEYGITSAMLDEILANFARAPGLIVGVTPSPHLKFEDRAGPQPGFVETIRRSGPTIWALLDLGRDLFQSVKRREWRGFSVELHKHSVMPEVLQAQYNFDGWVLTGGVFTNRPATNTAFRIAAEAGAAAVFTSLDAKEESQMPDEKSISLSAHESKVTELNTELTAARTKVTSLETTNQGLQSELVTLRGRVQNLEASEQSAKNELTLATAGKNQAESSNKLLASTIRSLETTKTELELKLGEQGKRESDTRIRTVIAEATNPEDKAGALPPALFEGYEADPTAYVLANYASLDAFENHVRILRGVGAKLKLSSAPVKSGHDSTSGSDPEKTLTAEEAKAFESLEIGTEFVGVTTEAEARKIHEARQKAAAK